MSGKIKILIADDHPIVRRGMVTLLQSYDPFQIIAECGTGKESLAKILELRPDIAILDISMPDMNGLDIVKQVDRKKIPTKFIILTMDAQEERVSEALDIGVDGYVLKENAIQELVVCIQSVLKGKPYITASLSHQLIARRREIQKLHKDTAGFDRLTPTERSILRFLSDNLTSQQIADRLFISVRTVQNHRDHIAEKLNLKGPHKLLEFAIKNRSRL